MMCILFTSTMIIVSPMFFVLKASSCQLTCHYSLEGPVRDSRLNALGFPINVSMTSYHLTFEYDL